MSVGSLSMHGGEGSVVICRVGWILWPTCLVQVPTWWLVGGVLVQGATRVWLCSSVGGSLWVEGIFNLFIPVVAFGRGG